MTSAKVKDLQDWSRSFQSCKAGTAARRGCQSHCLRPVSVPRTTWAVPRVMCLLTVCTMPLREGIDARQNLLPSASEDNVSKTGAQAFVPCNECDQ